MKKELYIAAGVFVSVAILVCAILFAGRVSEPKPKETEPAEETTTQAVTAAPDIDVNDELLILVNYANEVPDDWELELVDIQDGKQLDKRAAGALKEMMDAAREAGLDPFVRSAYRSKSTQTDLYNNKISEYRNSGYDEEKAKELAGGWVAIPGTSEHQLGLAADIVDDEYRELNEKQEETKTQKWLMEHCWEFGFILRYPNDKKEITHINYEPWHYRYVGKENAQKIKASGLCLEEFLGKAD